MWRDLAFTIRPQPLCMGLALIQGLLFILLKDTLRWCLVIVSSGFLPKIERASLACPASELSFPSKLHICRTPFCFFWCDTD